LENLKWVQSKPYHINNNHIFRIFANTGFTASYNDSIEELIRGTRAHFPKLLKKVSEEDLTRAQLGLAHQYSREKCATDVNRQDKPII
jgi:nucleolar protein 56